MAFVNPVNPVHAFVVPLLFVVAVPLALFAGITTTLAFSVLIFRVLVVYLDIALSLVPRCFAGRQGQARRRRRHGRHPRHDVDWLSPSPAAAGASYEYGNEHGSPTSMQQPIYRRRRRRPSSATSVVSAGSTTPIGDMRTGLGLLPSVGPERDYEGVGGWRSAHDDDESWTTINSRFEYPDRAYARGHHRTPSGGLVTPGDGGVLMMGTRGGSPHDGDVKPPTSPSSSRARTPSASRVSVVSVANSDGYFPLAMSPTATKKLTTHPI